MTIAPSTLCYIVGYHGHAGRICTVVSGPHPGSVLGRRDEELAGPYYIIDINGQRKTRDGYPLGALPCNLIPITPPGVPIVERDYMPEAA